jgi:hypothetical protein
MKKIEIKGKRNIDKINKDVNPVRNESKKWNLDNEYYSYSKQLEIVNILYLEQDTEDKNNLFFKKQIEKKIKGYEKQDHEKNIYDDKWFVNFEYIIEKMVTCKLHCYYCDECCELIYREVLRKKQWTLDRIDNDYGHNRENVVICCLECNIKRGSIDSNRYKMGKQLKINKL